MRSSNGEANQKAHMSLVIETLGSVAGSSVLSIGATMFDPHGREVLHENARNHLYLVINSFDSQNHGLIVQPKTTLWWKDKAIWPQLSNEVNESPMGVQEACQALVRFLNEKSPAKVWCNSPKFHLDILRALCKKARMELPVDYREEACYRTIMDVTYPRRELRPPRAPALLRYQPHHALGDAIYQAHQIIETYDYLALPGPDGPAEPLHENAALAALESLSIQEKDAMLMRLLTGKASRLTRDDVLRARPALQHVDDAEPEPDPSRSRLRPN